MKDKVILVTGATGLLGYNLVKLLINRGGKVIALGRSEEKLIRCFNEYMGRDCFSYIASDISGLKLSIGRPVDYIFHAAGSIELKTMVEQPMNVVNPNCLGTVSCLEFLKEQEIRSGKRGRLIFFSSEAVYGKSIKDRRVTENDTEISDPLNVPRTPYSHSKRMGEIIANSYHRQYNTDSLSVRLGWVYGNAAIRPKQALFDFIQTALEGKDIIIRNANTPRRDNIFMKDAMEALFCVAENGTAGEAYNISSGGDKGNFASPAEIAELVADIVNEKQYTPRPVHVLYETELTEREGGIIMDNSKLKALGWDITTELRDGIEILIDEVKNNVY